MQWSQANGVTELTDGATRIRHYAQAKRRAEEHHPKWGRYSGLLSPSLGKGRGKGTEHGYHPIHLSAGVLASAPGRAAAPQSLRPNLPSQMPSGSAEIIQRSRGLIGQDADPNHIITAFVNDDLSREHRLPERIVVAVATEDRDVG